MCVYVYVVYVSGTCDVCPHLHMHAPETQCTHINIHVFRSDVWRGQTVLLNMATSQSSTTRSTDFFS